MQGERFTRAELFRIRNAISINEVIEHIVALPCKVRDGHLRFVCPVCSEANTATNPKTNLARCFRCRRNFNPIDMVMLARRSGFVEAVRYLKGQMEWSRAHRGLKPGPPRRGRTG